ncbi:cytochrome P450 [Phlyctochytrium arcticum]|nr:cytochrome P450 [Phlyctochytrium arcticum]
MLRELAEAYPVATAIFAAILIGISFYRSFTSLTSRGKVPIPGPNPLPIFGNIFELWPYARKEQVYVYIDNQFKRYGGKILQTNLPGRKEIATIDAASAKRILFSTGGGTTEGVDFIRSPWLQSLHAGFIKDGLFMIPSGPTWKHHRKFLQPAFGPSHLRLALNASVDSSRNLVRVWKSLLEKSTTVNENGKKYITVDAHEAFSCLTMDVIGRIAFSWEFKSVDGLLSDGSEGDINKKKNIELISHVFSVVIRRAIIPNFLWSTFKLATKDAAASTAYIYDIVNEMLVEKRAARAKAEKEGTTKTNDAAGKWDKDLLDRLLNGDNEGDGKGFTDQELMDELFAFFLAGHETTANSLTFALYRLILNPHALKALRDNTDQHLGPSGDITHDNISKLTYSELVIKESLRIDPVVSGIPRTVARQGVSLLGHEIPKGTIVFAYVRGIHHCKEYWPEPEKFDPSRWENNYMPPPGTYLPFGDGPMNCIGQKLAMMESRIGISEITRHFDFEIVPGQDLTPRSSITTGFKNGLFVNLTLRDE